MRNAQNMKKGYFKTNDFGGYYRDNNPYKKSTFKPFKGIFAYKWLIEIINEDKKIQIN